LATDGTDDTDNRVFIRAIREIRGQQSSHAAKILTGCGAENAEDAENTWYRLRWVSNGGEKGEWSRPVGAMILG
jgi:hypothetical protein